MRRFVGAGALLALVGAGEGRARATEGPWHPDGVMSGVQVEHRDVPGSSFHELRLSIVTTVSVARLCEAIYPTVFPTKLERRFKKQELLRETANDRWTYEQISVPVVSDRDYVVHVKRDVLPSTGQCAISFATEDDPAHPPVNGFVRIPVIRGHWDVFPMEGGKVSVQYRIFAEPGGGVPAWVARGSQRSTAIDFLKLILGRAEGADGSPGPAR